MSTTRIFTEVAAGVAFVTTGVDRLELLSPAAAAGILVTTILGFAALMAHNMLKQHESTHTLVQRIDARLGDGESDGMVYEVRQAMAVAHHARNQAQIAVSHLEILKPEVEALRGRLDEHLGDHSRNGGRA